MLLVALADRSLAQVAADGVVAVVDHVGELVGRDERQALAADQDDHQRKNDADNHPEDVLRQARAKEAGKVRRVKRPLQLLERSLAASPGGLEHLQWIHITHAFFLSYLFLTIRTIPKPSAHTMSAAASETTKGSAMERATTMHRAVQITRTTIEAAAISSKGERYPIADDCASIVRERFRPTYNGAKLAMPATIPRTIARTIFVKSPVAMRPSVQT